MGMKSIITISLGLISLTSYAQDKTQINRKGFAFGTSVGISDTNMSFPTKTQTNKDLAINWKIGYMLNPQWALLLNGAVSIYEYNLIGRPRKRDFGGIFPSVQYWGTERFSILGGVGLGTDAPVFYDLKPENEDETKYYSGLGFISSFNYEVYQKKNFTIDIQARLNYSSVNLPEGKINGFNTGLLLGINFY